MAANCSANSASSRRSAVYFRAHNMLTSGDGTPALKWGSTNAYTEDASSNPIYDWTITDRIFDAYLANGVRPYVQLGFMPEALSIKPQPYRHHWTPKAKYDEIYRGWTYPPNDYAKWAELCYQWAKHCLEKYGRDEVETWWWETLERTEHRLLARHAGGIFQTLRLLCGRGAPRDSQSAYWWTAYCRRTRRNVPRALFESLPHRDKRCEWREGDAARCDWLSRQRRPRFIDGHVRMGISNQLRNINDAFAVIAKYPQFQKTPIVIGESDPDGCAACQGPQLGYRNTTMYSSYTAASFARKHELAAKHGVNLEGALTWAFEFEDQPYFAGFAYWQRTASTCRC